MILFTSPEIRGKEEGFKNVIIYRTFMKMILKSSLTILAVAAIATGATLSFFADTEVSENNTFSAGNIDLKVDSTAHYDGLVCVDGQWEDEGSCQIIDENLISDGSFEAPKITQGDWQVFDAVEISPWQIVGSPDPGDVEGLEYQKIQPAADGTQYVELDSYYPVQISQEITATSSGKYQVTFSYAPRPGHADNQLEVVFDGNVILSDALDGIADPFAWKTFSQVVDGPTSGTFDISFAEKGTNDQLGMFLDAVEIYPLACDETPVPEMIGEACNGSWTLTDLGPTHTFFDIEDIKPGDWGNNAVSLHVLNDDAYACLSIDHVKNDEHDLIEPEEDAGDESENDGELAKNLTFFAWHDDGDNLWEDGEEQIFDPMIETGDNFVDGKIYPLFMPHTQSLKKGQTEYVGLSWCVGKLDINETDHQITCDGDGDMNDAQTDSFSANLTFYVEQTRHNTDFVCPEQ